MAYVEQVFNLAETRLSAPILSATQSTIVLEDASRFPTSAVFTVRIEAAGQVELAVCIGVSGSTLTIVRGQENTTALASASANAKVSVVWTARALGQLRKELGPMGLIVGHTARFSGSGAFNGTPLASLIYSPVAMTMGSAVPNTTNTKLCAQGNYGAAHFVITGSTWRGSLLTDPHVMTWASDTACPAAALGQAHACGAGDGLTTQYVAGFVAISTPCPVYTFDTVSSTWASGTALTPGENDYFSWWVDGWYVGGGSGTGSGTTSNVRKYVSGSWVTKASLPAARTGGADAVVGGKAYALSGASDAVTVQASNYQYDPVGNAWATKTSVGQGAYMPRAFGAGANIVYGGGTNAAATATYAGIAVYSPTENVWAGSATAPYNYGWGSALSLR